MLSKEELDALWGDKLGKDADTVRILVNTPDKVLSADSEEERRWLLRMAMMAGIGHQNDLEKRILVRPPKADI